MIVKKYVSRYINLNLRNNLFEIGNNIKFSSIVESSGYDTNITIYNSSLKKKVPFKTIRNKTVSWYCCGPTVYDSAHIGNLCSYMRYDIIRRVMMNYFGLNIIMVMNITDIDDKIISKANELKVDYRSVSEDYEKDFLESLKKFNIMPPTIKAKVTDHITDIIEFISVLLEKGYGYVTPDGSVYFPVNKYSRYGLFQPPQEDKENHKLKASSQDFALWKSAKPGEPFWNSPWGKGRPGWHIECSTIASKFIGERVDLHSGGIDLKFPHHENEEAQCCARHGLSQWVNYWVHSGHLFAKDNYKMSKSLKNTVSVNDFLSSYTENNLRTICLLVPYRNNIEFRQETIDNAIAIEKKFSNFLFDIRSYLHGERETRGKIDELALFQALENARDKIQKNLANDFDTSGVISQLLHLISATNSMLEAPNEVKGASSPLCLATVFSFIQDTLLNLGYSFTSKEDKKKELGEVVNSALNFRSKIRETALGIKKNSSQELLERKSTLLNACDTFREDLLKCGIEVKDQGKSTVWNVIDYKSIDSEKIETSS